MRHKDPKNCRLLSLVRNVGMERKKVPTTGRKTIWTLMRFDPNSHSLGLLEVKPLYDLIESLCSTLCILAHSPSE